MSSHNPEAQLRVCSVQHSLAMHLWVTPRGNTLCSVLPALLLRKFCLKAGHCFGSPVRRSSSRRTRSHLLPPSSWVLAKKCMSMRGIHALCMRLQYHKWLPCNDTLKLLGQHWSSGTPKILFVQSLGPWLQVLAYLHHCPINIPAASQ